MGDNSALDEGFNQSRQFPGVVLAVIPLFDIQLCEVQMTTDKYFGNTVQ